MSLKIKAKILNMTYDKDNNLFQLFLEDVDKNKQTNIAIKGTDWGITPEIPEDIIKQFCNDMIGKEKILHIEKEENSSLRDAEKDDKGIVSQEEINRVTENIDNYPINEVMNILHKDIGDNED